MSDGGEQSRIGGPEECTSAFAAATQARAFMVAIQSSVRAGMWDVAALQASDAHEWTQRLVELTQQKGDKRKGMAQLLHDSIAHNRIGQATTT